MNPAANGYWLRESDPESGEGMAMDKAIARMRDEVIGVQMRDHRGHNRELALAITKLDEATLWAQRYRETIGAVTVVPRDDLLRKVTTDATGTTDA